MTISVFMAKIIGPFCIAAGLGIMFNAKTYQRVIEDFFRNSALIYLGGVFALLFGLLIVLTHNIWVANWTVIITVFGWLALIKGIWLIVLPNTLGKITGFYSRKTGLLVIHSVIMLVLGLYLTIMGYFIV